MNDKKLNIDATANGTYWFPLNGSSHYSINVIYGANSTGAVAFASGSSIDVDFSIMLSNVNPKPETGSVEVAGSEVNITDASGKIFFKNDAPTKAEYVGLKINNNSSLTAGKFDIYINT